MIPRIIHQIWNTQDVPERFRKGCATWRALNPGWEYRLWTHRDLLEFVRVRYPDYLETFCSYPAAVQRADAGRYLLLNHFGGIYADLDTECRQSIDGLVGEDRVVLSLEPVTHWAETAALRGHPYLIFNGIIASPAGHPFWPFLLGRMRAARHALGPLDSTGPCLLTGCHLAFPGKDEIRLDDTMLFNPVDAKGVWCEGDRSKCLAVHQWAGTWWTRPPEPGWFDQKRNSIRKRFYRARTLLKDGRPPDQAMVRAGVSREALDRPLPAGSNIAVLVPVRDAAHTIDRLLLEIDALEVPKERLKLVFCEGDSIDGTFAKLSEAVVGLKERYRDVILFQEHTGTVIERAKRWHPRIQRMRRAALAKVRNALIDRGLDESDDWALWVDADVWRLPSDIVSTLLAAEARIVVPDCVIMENGPSVDLNSFMTTHIPKDHRYYRLIRGGIFQPPQGHGYRRYLSDLRHSDRVPLDSVGGTLLLVDAALHRGGLRFPEQPYDDLIETQTFGRLARDLGVQPVGLPHVQIMHVPW